MSELCFECGGVARERHHVVPRSRGGTQTVWLCCECHGKVHGMKRLDVGQLSKEGIERRRAKGLMVGSPPKQPAHVESRVIALRLQGLGMKRIADVLNSEDVPTAGGGANWHASTVRVILVRRGVK